MNQSKLIEWLLENDCPYEWEVDDTFSFLSTTSGIKIRFYENEEVSK